MKKKVYFLFICLEKEKMRVKKIKVKDKMIYMSLL